MKRSPVPEEFRARPRSARTRFFSAALAALAGAGLLAACSESAPGPVAGSNAGSTLSVAIFQNPDSLDPAATSLVSVAWIDAAVFDTLIYRFPGDSKWYPGLATNYTVSPDGMTYTFTLRSGVKFQDGTPFNAAAVKATFDHIADPATKSKSALGALGPYKATTVVDDTTVQIAFTAPNLAFANEVAQPVFGISSPTAIAKYGANYGTHPVGTGPFTFQSFQSGQQVMLTRNPDYTWGPTPLGAGPAKLSGLTFRVLSDSAAQRNALGTGEISIAGNLTPQDVASAVAGGKQQSTSPSPGMPYGLLINVTKAPTNDPLVRQALEYAIDRKSIISTLFEGQYDPADSVLTPATPGYQAGPYGYDPIKAGQLLDQAGWKLDASGVRSNGGTPLSINMINIANFGFDDIAQLLQTQLKKVGIGMTLSDQGFPAVATTYNQGASNLANWFYYDADPYTLGSVFACNQVAAGFNWAHYCDPATDKAITAANGTVDNTARQTAYQAIVAGLNQQAAFMPIYNTKTILVTNGVKGIKFGVTGQPLFTSATR